jgi:Tol biopolymer transport system component
MDRRGMVRGKVGDPGVLTSLALSPDGTRAALTRGVVGSADVWLLDFGRSTSTRFTFRPNSGSPIWSPDGSRILFRSNRDGPFNLYQKAANGATNEEAILTSPHDKLPTGWSRDGRYLLYTVTDPNTNADLWLLPLNGERTPIPFLRTAFNEDQGHFSPDGHWVAYRSDESGRSEVYVRGFSPHAPGAKVLVSTRGGSDPRWRSDGKELFYVGLDGTLMTVDVATGSEFRPGPAKPLFKVPTSPFVTLAGVAFWDAAPDGSRFLVPVPVDQRAEPRFTVVLNWQAGLKH